MPKGQSNNTSELNELYRHIGQYMGHRDVKWAKLCKDWNIPVTAIANALGVTRQAIYLQYPEVFGTK